MHPQLSPVAAQIRFEELTRPTRRRADDLFGVAGSPRRRWFGRRPPPGSSMAPVVALPVAAGIPAYTDRRVA